MPGLDPSRWKTISRLLDELLDVDAAQRTERLAQLRAEDPDLAEQVAALLERQAALQTEEFLEASPLDPLETATLAGLTVGSYTLDRPIGHGGMGTVWLARRSDGRYEGQAAVKFVNLALLGRGGAERFRREANVLAKLAHPNITHLVDAGVASGQPYLVLEYVEGEPIDRWCDAQRLDVAARLRLFLQVLAAVSHAHGRLILHRDLKPSNILVTPDGRIKLLDFGIAKLLEDEAATALPTELTQHAGHAFTPEYAAPEQVQKSEATTATDVYALGVLLYVLLAGTHPTASANDSPVDRLRALVEREPARLSDAALRVDAAAARSRAASPAQLVRALRGDLDNIVAKALKKSPAERYPTADAFAADLQRHLNHQPVTARPDALGYRAAKFIRRHRLAASAATAVFLAVLAGSAVSVWQAREASLERDRALGLSARYAAVVEFVSSMLTEVAPADEPVRVADLLDRSVSMLQVDDANPDHQAAILGVLSNYFISAVGDPAKAKVLLDRALELTSASTDQGLRGVLLCDSGYTAMMLGRRQDATTAIEQGLVLSRNDDVALTRCLQHRAGIARISNDPKEAIASALQALTHLHESNIARPAEEAVFLDVIASASAASGRFAEADGYFEAALAKLAQAGRAEGPRSSTIHNNWGVASYAAGDHRRALENYDAALRIAVHRSPGGKAPSYLLSNRGKALRELARYPEALAVFESAIDEATRSENVVMRVDGLVNRAATYLAMTDLNRAEQDLAAAVATAGQAVGPQTATGLSLKLVQARTAAARGRLDEALSGLSAAVDFFEARKVAGGALANALRARADVYLQQGDLKAARADAQRALAIAREVQGEKSHSSLTGLALSLLARIREQEGLRFEARTAAAEAVAHLSETLGAEHPETLRARQAAD